MKVTIEKEFWELFPQAEIELLILKGIDNQIDESQDPVYAGLLKEGSQKAQAFLEDETFSQNEVIQEWRQAFTKFKTKKGARSSIEALLKRAAQGHEFSPINPLVDLYNSISLSYALPCGGEDLDQIADHMRLGLAKGGESFFPLGADKDAPALEGELIYADQKGAICRCLNWREAQRTMLTEQTKNAILVIEAINPSQVERARVAIDSLQALVKEHLGVQGDVYHLTAEHPSLEI